ncbi:hypothetical protein [Corynebacterium mastitidis]|uniref:Uncharacterized protein n=2 Tax=Corynebacterium mastitidis TaxID=161890 RepID=A0A2N0X719_9CORY|nr:hypothetical protein [Corynebacterium mastitidis]PKF68498.1 hypothetical protein CXB45_06755 [Corynebacterium mastitidis]
MKRIYDDAELEAMVADFEGDLSEKQLSGAVWTEGPMAWLLDVMGDDWEAFAQRAREENYGCG